MPRMTGIECLHEIRQDPDIKDTIVFILTTSASERDKSVAYDLNVSGYVLKENVGEDFERLVALLEGFWSIVQFPEEQIA